MITNFLSAIYKFLGLSKKQAEVLSYLIFGGLTTIVNFAVYFFSENVLGVHYLIAQGLSWVFAVLFAYETNRRYVFQSTEKSVLKEITSFFGGRFASGLIEMGLMFLSVSIFHFNDGISKIVISIITVILNYVISKLFVFKHKKNEETT